MWNGRQEKGLVYTTNVTDGRLFCFFDFTTHSVEPLTEYRNVLRVVRSIIDIWRPVIVRVEPEGYEKKRVFADRPSVGWMLHLPFTITASQVPEAADLIAVMDGKKQTGTIVVSVADTFDMNNPEHIARANAIETRLVDQDLLPTNMELLHTLKRSEPVQLWPDCPPGSCGGLLHRAPSAAAYPACPRCPAYPAVPDAGNCWPTGSGPDSPWPARAPGR